MRHYDDETLGAYVDGELDRQSAEELEADLRNDPALQRRVTELHAISTALREWCADQARPREAAWPFAASVNKPNGRFQRAVRGFTPLWSHALAASLALVFGVSVGQFVNLSQRQTGAGDDVAAQRLLQAALEHTMSGQEVSWTDNVTQHTVTVQPLRTYRASGTFCREYRETAVIATQTDERTMYGLACRSREGTWSVEYTLASGARSILANQ
jgi:surface antigen